MKKTKPGSEPSMLESVATSVGSAMGTVVRTASDVVSTIERKAASVTGRRTKSAKPKKKDIRGRGSVSKKKAPSRKAASRNRSSKAGGLGKRPRTVGRRTGTSRRSKLSRKRKA